MYYFGAFCLVVREGIEPSKVRVLSQHAVPFATNPSNHIENLSIVVIYQCTMRQRKYTNDQFIEAIKNNFSVRNALKTLGVAPTGGSYKLFYQRVKQLNLDISHFTGQSYWEGKSHPNNSKIPLTDILVKHGNPYNTSMLRLRLISENILSNQCSKCGISTWQGEPLSLHLDHIDGDNNNNLIENLRLLCPNCHSQTPTYCGRNEKRK